ncbi:MAG: BMP family ABC transporter substrate-binding protein [Acidimicrobiia bacterium]|nr:BMP family ABC transporter substrate-binding protein [Acidimicrobiia bacterium]MYC57629.1 BMP family ABC transporter substrate-binding protein [Acidimicrobiia bacterium]MYG94429.1 BMP family ABC transporter substrate-binding protein [Acidimicrobiia bacterium]MYI30718.1 BMP family ABC transporter substrate-binding protein [Acidimicrobiia bacterium]
MFLKLLVLMAVFALVATACGNDDSDAQGTATDSDPTSVPAENMDSDDMHDEVVAAFVYVGPVGDAGWTWAHNEGRRQAESATGASTPFVENVPEEGPDFRNFVVDFIENEQADVVFATSFGYMDAMEELAGEYPNVVFEHASGYKKNDTNFGNYFGRMYQPRYLSGMAAGALTATNQIGYVAAFPIPEVLRGINAFTLGAQRVNPDVEVHVTWTFTWFDPAIEGDSARALLEAGADVIAMHQDSTAPGLAAQDAGARWVSYNSDMSAFAPDAFITAPIWNWGPYYTRVIEAVQDGSYEPGAYWGGMADGIVDLAPLADDVPEAVVAEIEQVRQALEAGTWDVFTGEIVDQDGNVVVAEGETMNDGDMLGMEFLVAGVVGSATG